LPQDDIIHSSRKNNLQFSPLERGFPVWGKEDVMSKQFLFMVVCVVVIFSSCDNPVSKKSNPCANDPCVNGACVVTGESSIRCECEEGFAGWLCDSCAEGYEPNGNGGCEPVVVDPCDPNPCVNGECLVTGETSIQCECDEGYDGLLCDTCAEGYEPDGNGGCEPIVVDPCDSNPCANGNCIVDGDSFVCDCDEGYTGTLCADCAFGFIELNDGTCVVDDCQNQTCAGHGTCSLDLDTGVAACACDAGYQPDGLDCTDTNECLSNPCPEHSTCTNLDGSYECECTVGYTGLACDECANGFVEVGGECVANTCEPNPCQNGGTCSINGGVATCACSTGYTGTYCEDCSAGYVRLNNGTCVVDACAGEHCSLHGQCLVDLNTGVPYCNCFDGYEAQGLNCVLIDVDECALGTDSCDSNATCANTYGSYTCECNTGYTGDGFVCSNVNECLSNPCNVNATCTDTLGSFTCTCNSGYTGNGFSCSDINECASNPCSANATCTNIVGSYTCTCIVGYTGSNCDVCDTANGYTWNGSACTLDPCFGEDCNGHGTCSVVAGLPVCACETGYTGTDCGDCADNYRLMGGFCQPMFGRLAGGAIFEFAEANGELYGFGQNEVVVRYDEVEDSWREVWRPDMVAWNSNNEAIGIRNDFMSAISDGTTIYLLQHYFSQQEWTNIVGSNRNIVRIFTPGAANPWGQLADLPPTGTISAPIHCNDLGTDETGSLLWAVCNDGTVYKYNFGTNAWDGELVHDSTSQALNKIWVESEDSIFVAGDAGFLKRWNGASWEDWRSATLDTDLYGVWGYASSDLYVGGRGKLWHWNGAVWTLQFNQNSAYRYVRKIHGTADHSRVIALAIHDWNDNVGFTSHVWQSVNNGAWTGAQDFYYWSIHCKGFGVSGDECFVGGTDGVIDNNTKMIRLSGAVQEKVLYLPYEPLGVSGHAQDDLFFVGNGVANHYDGRYYHDLPIASLGESDTKFMATWADGLGGYWVVGPKPYILYWDGVSYTLSSLTKYSIFTPDFLSTDKVLAIHGSSSSNVWAVGHKGATFHWDGSSWTRHNLPHTTVMARGILVVSATEAYATARDLSGPGSYVYKWNGTVWSVVYTHNQDYYSTYNIIKDGVHICAPFKGGSQTNVVCSSDGGNSWSTFITTSIGVSTERIWGQKDNLFTLGPNGLIINYRNGQEIMIHRETSNIDDDSGSGRLIDFWKDPNSDFTVIIGISSKVLIHR